MNRYSWENGHRDGGCVTPPFLFGFGLLGTGLSKFKFPVVRGDFRLRGGRGAGF